MTHPASAWREPAGPTFLDRFEAAAAATPLPLGEASLLLAAHLGHRSPPAQGMAALEDLARSTPADDLEGVARHLCGTLGFRGNRRRYYDPANSLLPDVLRRRLGIPISLSIVVIDVARRRGIDAVGVGMPGHFLVAEGPQPTRWLDPFDGGTWLAEAALADRFARSHGAGTTFDPRFLAPTPDAAILVRALGNLVGIYRNEGDANHLVRALELRSRIIGPAAGGRAEAELAEAFVAVGRIDDAATCYEQLATRLDPARAVVALDRAESLRHGLN